MFVFVWQEVYFIQKNVVIIIEMATEYLESILFKLLDNVLRDNEKRQLSTWFSLSEHIDEESREEMKEALYHFVIDRINAQKVIRMLQRNLSEDEEDGEDDGDENSVGW